MKHLLWIILLLSVQTIIAEVIFSSVDSLLAWAIPRSTCMQSGTVKLSQAKQAKIAALLSIPEFSGTSKLSFTHNIDLPDTYVEAGLSTKSNTSMQKTFEVNLINLQGFNNVSQANLNRKIVELDNILSIKSLSENIAEIYYTIVNYIEQIELSNANMLNAEIINAIAQSKFNEGLYRSQDLNKSRINCINTQEMLLNYKKMLNHNYAVLKTFCEIPDSGSIRILHAIPDDSMMPQVAFAKPNALQITKADLTEKLTQKNFEGVKFSKFPKLSIFYSMSKEQNNAEVKLYDPNLSWESRSSWGLNLKMQLPFISSDITQISKARSDYFLAKKASEHEKIIVSNNCTKLNLDFEMVYSKYSAAKEVSILSTENYTKDLDLYEKGIISLEDILASYRTMIENQSNYISSKINLLYQETSIALNNKEN